MKAKRKIKILHVVGARPNYMKIFPVMKALNKYSEKFKQRLVHTGQHYDSNMYMQFFRDLDLPKPDIYLGVGSGSHAGQTAKIMIEFEKIVFKEKPDLIVVVGDVNSTLACSLVGSKSGIPVVHIEAGLRSFDRRMPEELNRIVTDSLSDILFTSIKGVEKNLKNEGIPKSKIFFTGNVMVDTLIQLKKKSERSKIAGKLGLKKRSYIVLTMHRPGNVDDKKSLQDIFAALTEISRRMPVIFPAHPRTVKMIEKFKIKIDKTKIRVLPPLGYLDFMRLYIDSKFVITDSGGIQEETTYLKIPCLTIRENTERPVTVSEGSNILIGRDMKKLVRESFKVLDGKGKKGRIPELWDGKAAVRIAKVLNRLFT